MKMKIILGIAVMFLFFVVLSGNVSAYYFDCTTCPEGRCSEAVVGVAIYNWTGICTYEICETDMCYACEALNFYNNFECDYACGAICKTDADCGVSYDICLGEGTNLTVDYGCVTEYTEYTCSCNKELGTHCVKDECGATCGSNSDCSCSGNQTYVGAYCENATSCNCMNQTGLSCVKDSCGAGCGNDGDCGGNSCNLDTCQCESPLTTNITFNVKNPSNIHLSSINILCNNSYSDSGLNSPFVHAFDTGYYYNCTLSKSSYYNNYSIFSAEGVGKEMNLTLSALPSPTPPIIDPNSITGQLVLTLGFGIMGLFAVLTLLGFGYLETTGKPDPETIAKIMIGVTIIILMIVAVWSGIVTPP